MWGPRISQRELSNIGWLAVVVPIKLARTGSKSRSCRPRVTPAAGPANRARRQGTGTLRGLEQRQARTGWLCAELTRNPLWAQFLLQTNW